MSTMMDSATISPMKRLATKMKNLFGSGLAAGVRV